MVKLESERDELLEALKRLLCLSPDALSRAQQAMTDRDKGEYSERIIADMQPIAAARAAIAKVEGK